MKKRVVLAAACLVFMIGSAHAENEDFYSSLIQTGITETIMASDIFAKDNKKQLFCIPASMTSGDLMKYISKKDIEWCVKTKCTLAMLIYQALGKLQKDFPCK